MSLESKIAAFMESSAGQKQISDKILEYRKSGLSRTGAGSALITEAELNKIASELASEIRAEASGAGVPASVLGEMGMVASIGLDSSSGELIAELGFTGNLHRDSQYPKKYSGVYNIVALFNNGYVLDRDVYGYWASHGVKIRGAVFRLPLEFMQIAVLKIKNKYSKYNLEITLSDDYPGDNGNWSQ